MRFTSVSELLDELTPAVATDVPDWNDVLARASRLEPVRRRQRWTRRRLVIAAAAALVLAILFATPAFGIRALILDLFGRTDVAFTGKTAPVPVKRNFFDLSLGLPSSVAPRAIASQTRRVATFTVNGKRRILWVAPTRGGGYCYQFDPGFGGCRRVKDRNPRLPLSATFDEPTAHGVQYVSWVGGDLVQPAAYSLTVKYANGTQTPLRFYYVSKPIAAGFFYASIPAGHKTAKTRVVALALRDKAGHLLGRQTFSYPTPAQLAKQRARMKAMVKAMQKRHFAPPPIRRSPPLPPPSSPTQRGTADGVTVVAGHNGVANFDTSGAPARVQKLIGGRQVDYTCLARVPYHSEPVDFGAYRTTVAHVAVRVFGAPPPFLGCEIQGVYGHAWPDRLHGHSAVEIPFTAAGRRYFQDRAAARDLALFVRSRALHTIRKLSGAALEQQLRSRYGAKIRNVGKPSSPLPANRIGYATSGATTTFVERSSTGRRFYVRVVNGHIRSQNVKPLAFVF